MKQPIKLFDMELSGNCYKVRLFCSLINLPYQAIPVNLQAGEHKQAAFLQINPRGQVPVIDDDGAVIWDSAAILVYLAIRYAEPSWLPLEAADLARVMQWLAMSENEIMYGLARARAINLFKRPWNLEECQALGKNGLEVLERHLRSNVWLAGENVRIADIACYPYVALAPEGGVALDDSPHVLLWLSRIQGLPGYVNMPGVQN